MSTHGISPNTLTFPLFSMVYFSRNSLKGDNPMRVFIYYNLHRRCWSVKALEGENKGTVIAHCESALLSGCVMKVSEKGRQRVLREKKKNVH